MLALQRSSRRLHIATQLLNILVGPHHLDSLEHTRRLFIQIPRVIAPPYFLNQQSRLLRLILRFIGVLLTSLVGSMTDAVELGLTKFTVLVARRNVLVVLGLLGAVGLLLYRFVVYWFGFCPRKVRRAFQGLSGRHRLRLNVIVDLDGLGAFSVGRGVDRFCYGGLLGVGGGF